jgi:hypothetical protein
MPSSRTRQEHGDLPITLRRTLRPRFVAPSSLRDPLPTMLRDISVKDLTRNVRDRYDSPIHVSVMLWVPRRFFSSVNDPLLTY